MTRRSACVQETSRSTSPYFADILHPIELALDYSLQLLSLEAPNANGFRGFRPRLFAPLIILTVLSLFLTIGLLVRVTLLEGGCAVASIILATVAASATSLATRWQVEFPTRSKRDDLPSGDLLIYGRNGAFILVRCDELLARTIYGRTHTCKYLVNRSAYQIRVCGATVMLMFGVVMMAESEFPMKIALGSSYLLLNGLGLRASLSRQSIRHWLWDLSSVKLQRLAGRIGDEETKTIARPRETVSPTYLCSSYAEVLRRIIPETNSIHWIKAAPLTPKTDAWDRWLAQAAAAAEADDTSWNPTETPTALLREAVVEDHRSEDRRSRHTPHPSPHPSRDGRHRSEDERQREECHRYHLLGEARKGVEQQMRHIFGDEDRNDDDGKPRKVEPVKRRTTPRLFR